MLCRLYNLLREADDIFKAPAESEVARRWFKAVGAIENGDGTWDAPNTVNLPEIMVKRGKIIAKFRKAARSFGAYYLDLKTLENCPEFVGDKFDCSNNKLTSLAGAPKIVQGDFDCTDNPGKFTEADVRAVSEVKGHIYV